MRTTSSRRVLTSVAAIALVTSGCGLRDGPVLTTSDEVVAALAALGDQSMMLQLTAGIEVDQGEVRALLREDDRLLELLTDGAQDAPADADELLAEVADARDELARHALIVAIGDDRSVRYAVETDDTVWLDLRARSTFDPAAEDLLSPFDLTYQAMVDLDTIVSVFDEADLGSGVAELRSGLDEARADALAEFPDGEPIFDLADGLLAGEVVGLGGRVDPRAWLATVADVIGEDAEELEGQVRELLEEYDGVFQPIEVDRAEALEAAFVFDGFRTDGAITVVDLGVKVREGGRWFLDLYEQQLAQAPFDAFLGVGGRDELATTFDEMRAALDDAPATLDDVGTLRFGPDGVLQQLRIDVLDVGAQVAAAVEPDDEDVATVADALTDLERTGLFVTVDVAGVGQLPSVLADADRTVSWEQLRGIVASLGAQYGDEIRSDLGGAWPTDQDDGGVGDDGAFDDLEDQLTDDGSSGALGGILGAAEYGLHPDEVAVGDCFDDADLYGPPGAGTTFPCSQPHDHEAYALVRLGEPSDPYDGNAVGSAAFAACEEAFAGYVGTDYFDSELFSGAIVPTEQQWAEGSTTAVCYLYSFQRETGSAAGSER